MTLKELRIKRGKWLPKPDRAWIRMMKRREKRRAAMPKQEKSA
jgi:hypothetical protein